MVTATGKAFPRAHLGDSNVVLVARALRFARTQSAPAGLRLGQSDRLRRSLKANLKGHHQSENGGFAPKDHVRGRADGDNGRLKLALLFG